MPESMSERTKHRFYLVSILLSAMLVRILVGLGRPVMSFEQSALIGLTSVCFLAPTLYRLCYGEELLTTRRKRVSHALSMLLSGGLFFYYIALAA